MICRAEQIRVSYRSSSGAAVPVFRDLSFSIAAGEKLCLVGPSGCGKTTLLLSLAGLLPLSGGELYFCGQPVNGPRKGVSVILQNYGLFPWMSVRRNLALPLELAAGSGSGRRDTDTEVNEMLEELGLKEKAECFPGELSGGQQQRVAVGRALISGPSLLLMDEPFSALDLHIREALEALVLDRCRRCSMAAVMATHDLEEAVSFSDRVLSWNPARGTFRISDNTHDAAMREYLREEICGRAGI